MLLPFIEHMFAWLCIAVCTGSLTGVNDSLPPPAREQRCSVAALGLRMHRANDPRGSNEFDAHIARLARDVDSCPLGVGVRRVGDGVLLCVQVDAVRVVVVAVSATRGVAETARAIPSKARPSGRGVSRCNQWRRFCDPSRSPRRVACADSQRGQPPLRQWRGSRAPNLAECPPAPESCSPVAVRVGLDPCGFQCCVDRGPSVIHDRFVREAVSERFRRNDL